MNRPFDPIELVELGYATRADSLDWMRAMAAPIIRGIGPDADAGPAFGYCLGPSGPEHVFAVPRGAAGLMTDAEALAELRSAHAQVSTQEERAVAAATLVPGIASAREVVGRAPDTDLVRTGGYVDTPVIIVHPADRPPAVFATLCRQPYHIDSSQRALWRKLAAHLGAGCRLSGRAASAEAVDVECVMTPNGRVVHAQGEGRGGQARDRIRAAVKAVDHARTRQGRSDAHAALELWRGLFCGRWSLVDHFDSDGKRFLLARRNDPDTPGPALPQRQRQVLFYVSTGWSNKEVGYALGIGEPTVAAHLGRALSTLNISSRAEWIRISAEVATGAADTPRPAAAHHKRQAS